MHSFPTILQRTVSFAHKMASHYWTAFSNLYCFVGKNPTKQRERNMKTLAYTLFLSLALCAFNARANTIHDIVQTGSIDPIDFYTGSQGLSLTGGEVHWQLHITNYKPIDQTHLIVHMGATPISGPAPKNGWVYYAKHALPLVASKLEIQEYHEDWALNHTLIMDEPQYTDYLDITVPDTVSTLPLLIAALTALMIPACSFSRFAPAPVPA